MIYAQFYKDMFPGLERSSLSIPATLSVVLVYTFLYRFAQSDLHTLGSNEKR